MKIFNIKQANIFIKNGAMVIGCGLGNRDKVYIEFDKNNKIFKDLMTRWMAKEFN